MTKPKDLKALDAIADTVLRYLTPPGFCSRLHHRLILTRR